MSLINIHRSYSSEIFGMFARAFSYIGGGLVIVLAYSVYATGMSVEFISEWAVNVLGLSFIVLLAALLLGAVLALLKVQKLRSYNEVEAQKWRQFGLQASSGIATLALTYTLLGICLGIAVGYLICILQLSFGFLHIAPGQPYPIGFSLTDFLTIIGSVSILSLLFSYITVKLLLKRSSEI